MGRDRNRKGHDTNRDSGPFVAMPCVVLDCPAYLSLSHPAKSLLLEIARQYVRDNNGRLLATRAYLAKRGWRSADTISRALRELIDGKLIHQTVQGHRPNKASWYAVTWRTLDRIPGYDAGATESFQRGSYAKHISKDTSLSPPDRPEKPKIVPPEGPGSIKSGPPNGPVRAYSGESTSPLDGHHLDKPSAAPDLRRCIKYSPAAEHASVTHKVTAPVAAIHKGSANAAFCAGHATGVTFEELNEWPEPANSKRLLDTGPLSFSDFEAIAIDKLSHD